jgi:putative 4-mercaptohistidine N1-methyltranferase
MSETDTGIYESQKSLGEYLLFHYGTPEVVAPPADTPARALEFPARCVSECLQVSRLPARCRALDLGCAVGRSTFELARHCQEVIGVDYSESFIAVANSLKDEGSYAFSCVEEGELTLPALARVPLDIDRSRVSFLRGDAENLGLLNLGRFHVVLMANLIDRLAKPRQCLSALPAMLPSGGQLIIISPYTWMVEFTPRENWLGGFKRDGRVVHTMDALQALLSPYFRLLQTKDLPFLIREHARKFQWSVAQATLWLRG